MDKMGKTSKVNLITSENNLEYHFMRQNGGWTFPKWAGKMCLNV